jgi:hypothetical protein
MERILTTANKKFSTITESKLETPEPSNPTLFHPPLNPCTANLEFTDKIQGTQLHLNFR